MLKKQEYIKKKKISFFFYNLDIFLKNKFFDKFEINMNRQTVCTVNLENLLLRDVSNVVLEFLTFDEQSYLNGNWNQIQHPHVFAANNGFLDLLQWAQSNVCEWNSSVCSNAARNGHLEVLKWARSNGCEWDSLVCSDAALNGHLEVLQWARSNGCEWNLLVCFNAASNGYLEIVKWARANGCK